MTRAGDTAPGERPVCPDGGTCHHNAFGGCVDDGCWRVKYAESGVARHVRVPAADGLVLGREPWERERTAEAVAKLEAELDAAREALREEEERCAYWHKRWYDACTQLASTVPSEEQRLGKRFEVRTPDLMTGRCFYCGQRRDKHDDETLACPL